MKAPDSNDNAENDKDSVPVDQASTVPDLSVRTLANGELSGPLTIIPPSAPEHLVGSIFDGKYEMLALLGQGGMSAVFKAKNLILNRIVAIKILLGNRNLNEQALMRFQQEARAASQLDHPNIIKVHDFAVSADQSPYMVMDYLEGSTIAELIAAEGQMDSYRAIDLVLQACAALEHAHAVGVVHRDLKPSNIMVIKLKNGHEIVKIVDFGVAKLIEEDQASGSQLTRTGEVFGSPLYMSPEQCLGKKIDARSDIYSLACVLYEELSGAPPFRSENVLATMHMHISDLPPELSKVRADLHNGTLLSAILLTALAKNPDHRYQTMSEFAAPLREAALKPQSGLIGLLGTKFSIFRKTQKSSVELPIASIMVIAIVLAGAAALWISLSNEKVEKLTQEKSSIEKTQQEKLQFATKNYERLKSEKLQKEIKKEKAPPESNEFVARILTTNPDTLSLNNGQEVTDAIIPVILQDSNLKTLYLRHTKLTNVGFIKLTAGLGKRLKRFSCTQNMQLSPDTLLAISHNFDGNVLIHMSMQGTRADDRIVSTFKRFKNLENLEVSTSRVTPRVFSKLPIMPTVIKVMLNNTKTDDRTLRDIAVKFPNLEQLHMYNTRISDKGLSHLKKLPLSYLLIDQCKVTDKAILELKDAVGPRLSVRKGPKV